MRHEIDESMLEVIKLLQDKNQKKRVKAEQVKSAQDSFTNGAKQFIAETLQLLKPFNPYGITCTTERIDVTRDFGEGEIRVSLEKLIVKEGVDTMVTFEPFSSQLKGSAGLRFRAVSPVTGTRTVVQTPPPFGKYLGWHMWTNEDDKSVDPEYLKMDKNGWTTIIKDHLLAGDIPQH